MAVGTTAFTAFAVSAGMVATWSVLPVQPLLLII